MSFTDAEIWVIIVVLGLGTYAIRFSFLGLIGHRQLPDWLLRHLRYTAVAILPALVTPLVLWPSATGGETDPVRLAAAAATLVVGYVSKSLMWGIAAGAGCFFALGAVL
jgi:branched-subunit amino acid transport protein